MYNIGTSFLWCVIRGRASKCESNSRHHTRHGEMRCMQKALRNMHIIKFIMLAKGIKGINLTQLHFTASILVNFHFLRWSRKSPLLYRQK